MLKSPWNELFRGKCSIYALDEISKQWMDRGISGQLLMFQSNQCPSVFAIKWIKNQQEIWWRLISGKLKPKGERALVLKAWDTSNNQQEILAIRFSDASLSQAFAAKFHQILSDEQQPAQHYQQQQQPNYHYYPQQLVNYAQDQYMMGQNGMNGGYIYQYPSNNNNNQYNTNNNHDNNDKWECAVCTYSNDVNEQKCIMCGLSQDSTQKANGSKATINSSNNSWICPTCTVQNNMTATHCNTCNVSRNMKTSTPSQTYIYQYTNHNQMRGGDDMNNSLIMGDMNGTNMIKKQNVEKRKHVPTVQEFQQSASDIACYNDNPCSVFSTLRTVTKKVLKDDVRYRTLDTTGPKVMERLIGFEGVLDFLMLLGFESDALGMKLTCSQKPAQQVVRNAIEVLNNYQSKLSLGRHRYDDNDDDILTLEKIVLWSTHKNMRDNHTMETLLLTHKQFTDSVTLLKNLRSRFNVSIPIDIKNDSNKVSEFRLNVQKRIQLKVIKSLRDWMKQFWIEDFLNNLELQKELILWLDELQKQSKSSDECPWIAPISSMLSKEYERFKLKSPNQLKQIEEENYKLDIDGIPQFLNHVQIKKGYKLNNITAEDLSDQITLINYRIFSQIKQREFIGECWKYRKEESQNVLSMIQQFNNLTVFVQLQILSEKSIRDRRKAIKRVIKMGQKFKELNNYHSLCAIVKALKSPPINRLNLAWLRVSEKQLNEIESFKQIFDHTFNFRNYRQLFRNVSPPAIPYFDLFLQDLVFIDSGAQQFYSGFVRNISFNKYIRTMDRIKCIKLYQTNPYRDDTIKSHNTLQKMLYLEFHKIKHYTEDMIWNISTKVKNADNEVLIMGLARNIHVNITMLSSDIIQLIIEWGKE